MLLARFRRHLIQRGCAYEGSRSRRPEWRPLKNVTAEDLRSFKSLWGWTLGSFYVLNTDAMPAAMPFVHSSHSCVVIFLNCAAFYNRYQFLMRTTSIRSLPHSASFADYKCSIKYVKSMLINASSLSINRCISDSLRVICICYTFHTI